MTLSIDGRPLGWGDLPLVLGRYNGERPPAPEWFRQAQEVPFERLKVPVAGCDLELLCWGERGQPGILLLHGSMAHAQWWAAIAPLLARDFRVCSLSFSGMGGSGHRDAYSVSMMAEEGRVALEAGGLYDADLAPIVACHSFGGKAGSLMAGNEGGERLRGMIFVDSFVVPDVDLGQPPPYRARVYPSEADTIARFRLSPDQPTGEPYIMDAIARAGAKQVPDGTWTWRFDPEFFRKVGYDNGWADVQQSRCRLAFLRGEMSSIVTPADEALQRSALRADTLFVEIPAAHHHIMIDQPLALVAAMRTVIEAWTKESKPCPVPQERSTLFP